MSADTCVSFTALSAGIYCSGYDPQMNAKNGFPVFSTHIEANYISKSTDAWNVYKLTDEDRQKITALAADPRIGEGTFHTGHGVLACRGRGRKQRQHCFGCKDQAIDLRFVQCCCMLCMLKPCGYWHCAAGTRIAKSIAPSIYGHDNIKMALALALFGGVEKQPSDSHRYVMLSSCATAVLWPYAQPAHS